MRERNDIIDKGPQLKMRRTDANDQGEVYCSEIAKRVGMAMKEEEWMKK